MELEDEVELLQEQIENFETLPKSRKETKDNLMWIEKYRPNDLSGVISHKNIIEAITKLVDTKKLPHLLFYGPPGTGKTTTILACARQLNGANWQSVTLELNASDERGIDVIRDRIKTFASTQQIFSNGFKLVILDEADAMTSAAQFALRRVIEKYTKNTRMCLTRNYVNEIIPALLSRCALFRFAPLDRKDIEINLQNISQIENINLSKTGLDAIINLSNGDMRKCLNILQATSTSYDEINEENVHNCTGAPLPKDIRDILQSLLNKDFKPAYDHIQKISQDKGLALTDILTGLHSLLIKTKLDSSILCEVLKELSDLEHRLAVATNDKIQLASLVGVFQIVRHKSFEKLQKKTRKYRWKLIIKLLIELY